LEENTGILNKSVYKRIQSEHDNYNSTTSWQSMPKEILLSFSYEESIYAMAFWQQTNSKHSDELRCYLDSCFVLLKTKMPATIMAIINAVAKTYENAKEDGGVFSNNGVLIAIEVEFGDSVIDDNGVGD
jgi:hypothetical protein